MSKRIEFEGVTQEFPDDFTDEDISAALSGNNQPQSPQQQMQPQNTGIFNLGRGMPESARNRTAGNVLRDLLGGLATGSQNLASSLLEGGEYITRKGAEKLGRDLGHPVNVPYWNAREFMGLEGDNPINLGKMIASKNPDPWTMAAGQYGIPALSGGANLLKQAITQGTYGASQASPQQENAFGLLPNGRPGAALKDAGLVYSSGKLLPLVVNGLVNTASTVKNSFNKINPREVSQSVQATHDKLLKASEDIFEKVGKTAKMRGADIVPIKSEIINKVKPFLADTRAVQDFLSKAEKGEYPALRKLQADLFRSGTKAEKAGTLADELKAQEIFDLRDRINESITDHFKKNGHTDLAKSLEKARGMYRNLKNTYYNKKLPLAVRDLVHPDVRKIPRNAMNTFSEESKPMENLIRQNPLVREKVDQHIAKKNAIKTLKGAGKIGAGIAGASLTGHLGKNLFDHYSAEQGRN